MEIHRSYFYYESVKDDTEVEEAIRAAAEYGDGFEKIFQRLRHDGYKTWSLDFVCDKMESGRTFRVLNILDDSNREAVAQEISMSMPAERVISILEKVIFINGKPECIRTDNGPEFISEKMRIWCDANGIKHKFIQPWQAYAEQLCGTLQWQLSQGDTGCVHLQEHRRGTRTDRKWRLDYNAKRPHEALGNMTPLEYKEKLLKGDIRSSGHSVPVAEANP